jgi:lysophospholipase L1-like esterase
MTKKNLIIIATVIVLAIGGAVIFSQLARKSERGVSQQGLISADRQERKFVALGASVTKANNLSSSLTGDNPQYSFATGTKVESVFLYLKNKGEKITAVNLAESGADSSSVLQKQVPNAAGFHPKYVTIDMMADVLEDATPSRLQQNLREIVAKLEGEDTIVLVGSYPNFPKLRSAPYPSCKEDKLGVGFDKLTEEKIQTFNRAIRAVAEEKGLIFVDLYNVLGPGDVSDYDCVHPNIEGQKKLARQWTNALR